MAADYEIWMLRVVVAMLALTSTAMWLFLHRCLAEERRRREEIERELGRQANVNRDAERDMHRRVDRMTDEVHALQHRVGALENRR